MTRPKNTRKCRNCDGTGKNWLPSGGDPHDFKEMKPIGNCIFCHGRGWLPYEFPLVIAADPGSATKPDVFSVWSETYRGIDGKPGIRTGPDLMDLLPAPTGKHERVLLVVEKSTARIPRFYVHRNAANGIIKRARAIWGRRLIVVTVDPRRWQGDLFDRTHLKGCGPKLAAEYYCHEMLDPPYHAPEGVKDPSDYYDARCLLEWGRHQVKPYSKGAPSAIGGMR